MGQWLAATAHGLGCVAVWGMVFLQVFATIQTAAAQQASLISCVVSMLPATGSVLPPATGTADTGRVSALRELAGVGVLIDAAKGTFLARATKDDVTVERAYNTGNVIDVRELAGMGVLIGAWNGLFLARATSLSASVLPAFFTPAAIDLIIV